MEGVVMEMKGGSKGRSGRTARVMPDERPG
jgi:hypothetical protein